MHTSITPDALFRRYQELQAYVGWTDDDARRTRSIGPLLAPALPALVDDFYAEIDRHPETRRVITGGPAQVERLKGTLAAWLHDLLVGPYDQDYVCRRWRAGLRHVEIGLDQVYTNVALSRLRHGLLRALDECGPPDPAAALALRRSLNTLLDLDLAIIEDAYWAEHVARQLESVRLSQRLALIGKMMTGLAHESANALARSRACLEMLAAEVEDRPEAKDLIERILEAQEHLQQLYQDVRGYAVPLKLEREPWDLAAIWRQAWDNLALQRQGKPAVLREETGGLDLECCVDRFRLDQVFRNILDNALAASPGPVEITIRCTPIELAGRPAICIAIRDSGPGLTAEQRQRIFEPFFTTKSHGTGLGMSIAQRIVEAHAGSIAVGASADPGAEIVVTLPRAPA